MAETFQEHIQREFQEHESLAESLPSWLVNKPDEFVRINRESEHYMLQKTLAQLSFIEKRHGKAKEIFFVGGGSGMEAEVFAKAGYSVTLSDLSPNMLRCAEKRFQERGLTAKCYLAADSQALPLEDNSFCVGIAYEALHHAPSPDLALRELARISSKGIILVEPFTSPAFDALAKMGLAHRKEYSGLIPYRFKKDEMSAVLNGCGFESWQQALYLRLPEDYLPRSLHEKRWFSRLYLLSMQLAKLFPALGNQGIVAARKPV